MNAKSQVVLRIFFNYRLPTRFNLRHQRQRSANLVPTCGGRLSVCQLGSFAGDKQTLVALFWGSILFRALISFRKLKKKIKKIPEIWHIAKGKNAV